MRSASFTMGPWLDVLSNILTLHSASQFAAGISAVNMLPQAESNIQAGISNAL